MSKKQNESTDAAAHDDECVIPPELPKAELHKFVLGHPEQARSIAEYVEWQCRGEEKVLHAEKVTTERVFGREHQVWDVHTDRDRWWVITNATNLYSQRLMPSADYTLSLHIGLMARVAARRRPEGTEAEQEFMPLTTRKVVQAGEAFDQADEAEEFQAVGMRCREALLSFVREVADGSDLGKAEALPKVGDFIAWNDRIANVVAPGDRAENVRGYLKTVGERAWRVANWLTHAANGTRDDARLALSATQHVIDNYAFAVLKMRTDARERCSRCRSYKIAVDWRPELGRNGLYVSRCEACGAETVPPARSRSAPRKGRAKARSKRS